jgi:hypothetical protein
MIHSGFVMDPLVFVCIYSFILEQHMDVKLFLFHTQIQSELSLLMYAFLPWETDIISVTELTQQEHCISNKNF